MKKIVMTMLVLLMTIGAVAQEEEYVSRKHAPILPGRGGLNLETMLKHIDTNMDISKLSLSELRVLRNAFAARQGYAFTTAELRSVFSGTSWYDSLMMARWEKEMEQNKELPVKYTPKETAFIKRIQAREKELLAQNYKAGAGCIVNTDNIVNPFQLESIDPRLEEALGRQGFAIVPQNQLQLFHIYEKNDYHDFPSFVTTDLYLQAFHFYFDCVTREVEEHSLCPAMVELSEAMYQEMKRVAATAQNSELKQAAERSVVFFAVAQAVLTNKPLPAVSSEFKQQAEAELEHINDALDCASQFLGYTLHSYPYSLYKPRGHYTRSETLKRYFKGMMWLQSAPFKIDMNDHLAAAALISSTLAGNQKLKVLYERVNQPITFLFGAPDNITMLQLNEEMKKMGVTPETLVGNDKKMKQLQAAANNVAKQQTRIVPRDAETQEYVVNLMPQRYMPDSEVLQEMQDYVTYPVSQRMCPKGLDVMAAIGIPAAERILLQELKEQQKWNGFTPALERMKQRMKEINWDETVANQWVNSLQVLCQQNSKYPYFMKTPQWDKKNLNSALASWAELKHDAILYAKQPAGAECGGGGPEEPIVKGYVEPNIAYWQLAITLIDATEGVFKKYGLATERSHDISERMCEEAQFLLNISQKELNGQKLNKEEYNQIEIIGSTFENISLDLLRQPNQTDLWGWDCVEGADRSIAVVADVFTANHRNIPDVDKAILYEAVGPAYEIYVVVEIDGMLYLTRGGVFSYREFLRSPSEGRWTDEEWQEHLKTQPRAGEPDWMKEIVVPLDNVADDETFFYSSGC